MKRIVVNVNVCILMGKIVSDLRPFTAKDGTKGCEFDIETKSYTESTSRSTIITCVSEGKQADLIANQKKKGDTIIVTGYLGEIGDIGVGMASFGRHKLRITRIHIEYLNYVFMGGQIVTEPIYNEKTHTTEFFLQTERFRGRHQLCRIRVICHQYLGQLVRAFKGLKSPGEHIEVIGLLAQDRSEHVILPSRIELLLPDDEKGPILRKLKEERERRDGQRQPTAPVPESERPEPESVEAGSGSDDGQADQGSAGVGSKDGDPDPADGGPEDSGADQGSEDKDS